MKEQICEAERGLFWLSPTPGTCIVRCLWTKWLHTAFLDKTMTGTTLQVDSTLFSGHFGTYLVSFRGILVKIWFFLDSNRTRFGGPSRACVTSPSTWNVLNLEMTKCLVSISVSIYMSWYISHVVGLFKTFPDIYSLLGFNPEFNPEFRILCIRRTDHPKPVML